MPSDVGEVATSCCSAPAVDGGSREPDPQEVSGDAPRVYYGWYVLGGLSVTQIVSWGILYYAFGTLMPSMQAELGWTASEITGAFSSGLLASALTAIPVGHYIDRHGARGVMTVGSCAASLLIVAWAHVETLPAFYAIWIGLGMAMSAVLYEPAFAVLVRWFVRRRAHALSILTVRRLPLSSWRQWAPRRCQGACSSRR